MSQGYIFATLIVLITVGILLQNYDYVKKIFKELTNPQGWGRVEIVDEKLAFHDFYNMNFSDDDSWQLIFIGLIAAIVSFTVGWSANNLRSVHSKLEAENKMKSFETTIREMKHSIGILEVRIGEIEKTCSTMPTEIIYSADFGGDSSPDGKINSMEDKSVFNDNFKSCQTSLKGNSLSSLSEHVFHGQPTFLDEAEAVIDPFDKLTKEQSTLQQKKPREVDHSQLIKKSTETSVDSSHVCLASPGKSFDRSEIEKRDEETSSWYTETEMYIQDLSFKRPKNHEAPADGDIVELETEPVNQSINEISVLVSTTNSKTIPDTTFEIHELDSEAVQCIKCIELSELEFLEVDEIQTDPNTGGGEWTDSTCNTSKPIITDSLIPRVAPCTYQNGQQRQKTSPVTVSEPLPPEICKNRKTSPRKYSSVPDDVESTGVQRKRKQRNSFPKPK